MTPRIRLEDSAGRAEAVAVLRVGGIVAIPTDTVYGIAVALNAPGGIERLFHVKQRPAEKGIALLLTEAGQAAEVGVPNDAFEALAAALWPGPLTLVIKVRPGVQLPVGLTGGAPTIGVRLPDHPTPRALAAAVGPLPTTSANLSGRPDALDATTVIDQLGERIDLVLDGGRTMGARPSTVVDTTVSPPRVLRIGAIAGADILRVVESRRA